MKHVVVVDEDIDIDNPTQVEWAIATRFRGGDEDLIIISRARGGSSLDPAAIDQAIGLTTKVGIDATKPQSVDPARFERARIPH